MSATLCRGQVWSWHEPWDPKPCDRPTDATLCWGCHGRLVALLDGLGDDLDELTTQVTKQARREQSGGSTNIGEVWPDEDHTYRLTPTPLALDLRASDVLADARSVLVGWTRVACDVEGCWPADTLTAMLRRLRRTRWRTHEAGDELLDELRWLHAQVITCIEVPTARRYLGPCGSTTLDGQACDGDVYAIGDHVRCAACRATHSRDERLEWIASVADDQLVSAAIAADVLSGWGVAVKAETIRVWAHRGRLLAHGHDRNGHPVYVLAEVRALAVEANARTAQRQTGSNRREDRSHSPGAGASGIGVVTHV